MGWFDESDDDDDDDVHQQGRQGQLPTEKVTDVEEEEDPLDAYMKTLEQPKQAATTTTRTKPKAERLDVEAEEEATSHWNKKKEPKNQYNDYRVEEKEDGGGETDHTINRNLERDRASRMIESTFHRAGAGGSSSNPINKKDTVAADNDTEDNDGTSKEHKQVSITLEQINHESIQYHSFRKQFWIPQDTSKGHQWRNQHETTCTPGTIDPILSWDDLSKPQKQKHLVVDRSSNNDNNDSEVGGVMDDRLFQVLQSKGYTKPTPVQSQTLPVALSGRDAVITASTGSGKTLSYVWPMVIHVCDQPHFAEDETGPIGIVLVPTRELASQVHKYVKMMLQPLGGKSLVITGGTNRYQLVQDLKRSGGGVEIVVATPGRFLDVLSVQKKKKNGGLNLSRVTFCVLDEADKMLDMGFESQVTEILKNVRPDRQSLLLSATMGRKVERVASQWLDRPVRIAVGRTGESSEHVQQHVMVLPSFEAKKQWLLEMLPVLANVGLALVFVATRSDCEVLASEVRDRTNGQLGVETLHGDRHQTDRNAALKAFTKGSVKVLIATDVAARGLDVPNVSTVINFDVAKNLDSHVHRIGRAGRLSKTEQREGNAYTLLVTPKNADFAHILVNAFEREGRTISSELKVLASKSRKSGNVTSRTKWNKAGLGFHDDDPSKSSSSSATDSGQNSSSGVSGKTSSGGSHHTSYYGPATSEPSAKRSRWG